MTLQEYVMNQVRKIEAENHPNKPRTLTLVLFFDEVIKAMTKSICSAYDYDLNRIQTKTAKAIRLAVAHYLLGRDKDKPLLSMGTLNYAEVEALLSIFKGTELGTDWLFAEGRFINALRDVVRPIVIQFIQKHPREE